MSRQFDAVPPQVNIDALEREILAYWEQENIFQQSLEKNKDRPLFSFYDGPPYAQGKPHYGHVLQSAIKDTVLRYKTMQGYYVPRRVGWDTHGLPVEVFVEKELGLKSKKDIEEYGIAEFNKKCQETVFRYIDLWVSTLKRLGRWADYEHAYATLERNYMESEWWVFRQLWDQGLIYQATRSTPYCIRCETPLSNFEVSTNYQDTHDTAVFVLLKLQSDSVPAALAGHDQYAAIWTTTPWTLPANVAVAFNPALTYVTVEHEGRQILLAQERVTAVVGADALVVHTWKPTELAGLHYEPLYTFVPFSETEVKAEQNAYTLVESDHVVSNEGTGLVHIAPAFGEEDHELAKHHHLPLITTITASGDFIPAVTPWAGQNIFAANKPIIADLAERQVLLKQEHYKHSYPFCWRCDTPLIYLALETWFVKVGELKEQMLASNEHINWTPKHVRQGRFGKGILSAPDWAVSRNRYWSTPVPIWECGACEHRVCIGSVQELATLSGGEELPDLHRPGIDAVTWGCNECSTGTMQRIPEVLDVWFDAGSMPYAQSHYPFENTEEVVQSFPADFIVESIEQTRLWFYVLHVLATALTRNDIGLGVNQPAFKNAIGSGLIFAEDGRKLSKKLKNYPEIEPTLEKYGADTLRFYLLTSASLGEPYRFSEKDLRQLQRNTYMTLWNVYSFFTRYAKTADWQKKEAQPSSHLLDRWIMARLRQLTREVVVKADGYQIDQAARLFTGFIDDLSNWYVRRSRSRFHPAKGQDSATQSDSQAAFTTLHNVLVEISKILAPFMPYVADAMYRNLTGGTSVHLQQLPALDEMSPLTDDDKQVLGQMAQAREVVSEGLALRARAKIKIRQPLAELVVDEKLLAELPGELVAIIADELNVQGVHGTAELPSDTDYCVSGAASMTRLALRIALTDELRWAGIARELIRHGQMLRREAGYELDDRIIVRLTTSDADSKQAIAAERDTIMQALQADEIVDQAATPDDAVANVKLNDSVIELGVRRP